MGVARHRQRGGRVYDVRFTEGTYRIREFYLRESTQHSGYESEVTFTKRPLGYFNVISEKFFMGALRDSKGSIGAVVSDRKLKHAEVRLKAWSIVDKVNGEQ